MRCLVLSFIFAACVVVAAAVFFVWRGASISLQAEQTHQAYLVTLDALTVYVGEHAGNWPKDWRELATAQPKRPSPSFRWPDDLPEFERRVQVDFSVTAADVAAMDAANFKAVQPIGANYGTDEVGIERLLQAIRK